MDLGSSVKRWLMGVVLCGAVLALAGAVEAAPRLALVDGAETGPLHQALQVSLQPWSFEVVDWPRPARRRGAAFSSVEAAAVAERANARYVVWYDAAAAELVVHDASLGREERRALAAMPADEVEASALALSIKTMLRLDPAPGGAGEGGGAGEARWRWLPAVRLGARFGLDGDGGTQLRLQAGLEGAPPRLGGLRFGLLGDLGSSTEVSAGNFRGEWREWSVLASVSKQLDGGAWRVTARAAAGLSRATLEGEEAKTARSEASWEACGQASVGAGRPLGPLVVGVAAAVSARGASAYLRANGQPLWDEPALLATVLATVELAL